MNLLQLMQQQQNSPEQQDMMENDPYYVGGFNDPGMRGSDPSMDYNSLMLNPFLSAIGLNCSTFFKEALIHSPFLTER